VPWPARDDIEPSPGECFFPIAGIERPASLSRGEGIGRHTQSYKLVDKVGTSVGGWIKHETAGIKNVHFCIRDVFAVTFRFARIEREVDNCRTVVLAGSGTSGMATVIRVAEEYWSHPPSPCDKAHAVP